MRSVDHESSWITATSGSPPSSVTFVLQRALHHLERRAAEERRRELDAHAVAVDGDVADHAEVDERDDRDLRVGDLLERRPDLLDRHHCAPGTERRTSVISFHSSASSGVCSPRSSRVDDVEPDAARQLRALLRLEHAERVRPQLVDRSRKARLVAQALGPHLGVHAVVDLFAVDLRGEARELGVVGLAQRVDPHAVGFLVEIAARDRVRPVDQAQLDERRAAVLLRRAVERERVRVGVELDRRELVERARVADLVLRDRRERDVLLERRRDPRPLRVAPAEDQLVVSYRSGAAVPARSRASFNRALIE